MSKQAFYNGILYQIEYQPQLSNNDYTQHKVYHIKTEEENYGKARKAIASIIAELLGYNQKDIWDKGLWLIRNKNTPSMANALHIYIMSSPIMRNLMCLYILLLDLMMIEYGQC